jgi:ABC-type multidrug transport system ATPase subunit
MQLRYILEDHLGFRSEDESRFPLQIGRGPSVQLQLNGQGPVGSAAVIAISANRLYICLDEAEEALLGDVVLKPGDRRWLSHGDRLSIAGGVLHVRAAETGWVISTVSESSGDFLLSDPSQSTRIVLFGVDQAIREEVLKPGAPRMITLGSDADCEWSLPTPALGGRQVSLEWNGEGVLLARDLGSGIETRLNGAVLPPHQPQLLRRGDRLHAGSRREFEIQLGGAQESLRRIRDQGEETLLALLHRKASGFSGTTVAITIGRAAGNDLVLNDSLVSKRHARIERYPDGRFVLTDLGSSNGTYVNGRRIRGSVLITPSDQILISSHSLRLDEAPRNLRDQVAIVARGIRKEFNGVCALHETSFEIPSRSVVAVMGPSGCGKSTLLKCLNGDAPATAGRVLIHGLDLIENYEFLKNRIGYVPQDDIVHGELSVEMSLFFAAKMRMEEPTRKRVRQKVDQVLSDLNMQDHRRKPVSKLSGGQRKRVCIALEMLTDPLVLFLDEPTSPLDPQTIQEFLEIIQRLAERGTTVVMVTHKPEDLYYMHRVLFLSVGGHTVYYGSREDYLRYFDVGNIVQVFTEISAKDSRERWAERWRKGALEAGTRSAPAAPLPAHPTGPRSLPRQFGWLTLRYLAIKTRDRANTLMLLGQAPIIAGLFCLIFRDITLAVPFFMAVCAIWFGSNNASREIVGELSIYRRERMFNLAILPYTASKLVVLSLLSALQSAMFVSILAWHFKGHESVTFTDPWIALAWMNLLSFAGTCMGLALSARVGTTEKVMTWVPILLIPQVMLAGVLEKIHSGVVEAISYLAVSRWGTLGFSLIQENVYGLVNPAATPAAYGPVDAYEGTADTMLPDGRLVKVATPGGGLHDKYHQDLYDGLFDQAGDSLFLPALVILIISGICVGLTMNFLRQKDSIRAIRKPSPST